MSSWWEAAAAALLLTVGQAPAPAGQVQEVIVEIRVHGNHIASDDEVVTLTGVTVGAPFSATTLAEVKTRLERAHRFDDVQVLKRFASIADLSRISLVIIVNEGPVRIELPDVPGGPVRVTKRRKVTNLMFMPIFDGEDGYGLTYGVRLAYVGVAGKSGRVSFPLTWGGLKRAGAEFDRTFAHGVLNRVEVGTAVQRQRNPAYDTNDDRTRVWAKAEKSFGPLRATASTSWQHVSFGAADDDLRTVGGSVVLDTRLDPVLPRNAVFASAAIEQIGFASGGSVQKTRLDGRGYVGLLGQTVLVVRAVREDANRSLPTYLRSILGGWSSLRGFAAGSYTGDTLVTGSIELRVPLTAPLGVAKLGVSAFVDTGTAYDKGQRFQDQERHTGIGGSVWLAATAFRMGLSVAHGRGATTRVNFGAGLSF